MSRNFTSIRDDFPILKTSVNGRPLIYLDNAATMQMPRQVMEAMAAQQLTRHANVHRGIHYLSEQSTREMEAAREVLRDFVNARSAAEIVFTSGTSQSLNMLAQCLARTGIGPGDGILVTVMEHHSNFVPWQQLCLQTGAVFKAAPLDGNGELDMDEFKKLLTPRTRMVSAAYVSNLLGTVNPVREIARLAHENGSLVCLDCAQAMRHARLDVQELDCDFAAFSGHKIGGPTGAGVLYGKLELLEELPPAYFGGGMVEHVRVEGTSFAAPPLRFETGTPNITGNIGLAAAARYISEIGAEKIAEHENALLRRAKERLSALPEVEIVGHPAQRSGVLSFNVRGLHCFDVASMLDRLGIAVRSGHHCAQPLLESLGLDGTVRVSPAFYNTMEEIDAFADGVERIIKVTGGVRNGKHP